MATATPQAPASPKPARTSWRQNTRAVQVFRFATTVTFAMAFAQAVNWPVSFVYVAVVIGLLPEQMTPRDTLNGVIYALVAYPAVFVLTLLFLPFPASFLLFYALAFFLNVYFAHKGGPSVLAIFFLVALVLLPILGNVHEGLSGLIGGSLVISSILGLATVQVARILLPDPERTPPAQAAYQAGYSPQAARGALKATAAIAPLMAAFLFLELTAYAVVMVYAAIIALGGGLESGRYNAKKYLIANTMGGIGALVFYVLMVAVPEYYFFVVLMFATSLLFGAGVFSDAYEAKYYGSALTGLVILISTSMGAGADIDVNVVKRIVFVILAGVYVISVMALMERLLPDDSADPNGH